MTEKYSFGSDPIICHDFNADTSQIAISPNNHEVHLYKRVGNKWEKYQVLEEHTQRVNGIAWAKQSNKIVTVAQDRNAYVWELGQDERGVELWKPLLVLLRINRAATCVSWSPLENKFAVGSGARQISVCFFEKEENWWVGKIIKKPIRSTITCVDWHPNNCLLAAGSTDFKTRVFSGYVKKVDEKPEATAWGKKMVFADLMAEFANGSGGWVQAVSFSADGNVLAWTAHDSSLSVVDATRGMKVAYLRHAQLPFLTLSWLSAGSLLAAGHDCAPIIFTYDGANAELCFQCRMDVKAEEKAATFSAMKKFQNFDKKATTEEDSQLQTTHQNSITQIRVLAGGKNAASRVSTVAMDGQLVFWDLATLEQRITDMRIS